MTIVKRLVKGSPLTNSELDGNFDDLDGRVTTAQSAATAAAAAAATAQTTANGKADASALTSKADLASPALTGNPTAPTQTTGDNTTKLANTAFVAAAITALKGTVPTGLDTLKKLADALGGDANFAVSMATALGAKADRFADVGLSGSPTVTGAANGNRLNIYTGAAGTVTLGTGTNEYIPIIHRGTGTLVIAGAQPPLSGYKNSLQPGEIGIWQCESGQWFTNVVDTSTVGGGAATPVSVSGLSAIGSTLTATIGSGWNNTGGNWTRNGANISGATSLTYVTNSGDGGALVTYVSNSIPYIPTGVTMAVVSGSYPYALGDMPMFIPSFTGAYPFGTAFVRG